MLFVCFLIIEDAWVFHKKLLYEETKKEILLGFIDLNISLKSAILLVFIVTQGRILSVIFIIPSKSNSISFESKS